MSFIPIVDAHVHLWDPERFRMSWTDSDALLNQAYTLETYYEQTRNLPIEALVFMECGVEPQYAFLEAQWAVRCAQQDARLQGVVAATPIEYGPRVRAYLDALAGLGPYLKGVRRNIQDEADDAFCLRPDFIHGVQLLPEYNFSFDICIHHWQLPAVIELVRRCPETQFILDHLGKPAARTHDLDPWRQHIRTLAALPNVSCKISGLVTEADPVQWSTTDLAPYIMHVLESFGEDRVVFAGDWPVMLSASSYQRWVETVQMLCASLPESAQNKLWHENARRFYRLDA
jgi:L-fuconolactonase